ncbi:MAG: FKBP-type peptidyl-prolyl cis-trans isomerase [Armatimonas sp.]
MSKAFLAVIPFAIFLAGCPSEKPAEQPTPGSSLNAEPSVVTVATPEATKTVEAGTPTPDAKPIDGAKPAEGTKPAESMKPAGPEAPAQAWSTKLGPKAVKKEDGLQYEDLKVGTGKECPVGASVTVHYTGWLTNGTKFDSSVDRGQPASFSLDQVVKGWGEGIPGMKIGGKRKLVIPPALGYGEGGTPDGTIPPNSTLVFEVELLEIQ